MEQIGSVYETMMGFRLETASGRSVAIKAAKKQGAPTTVDLDALVAEPGARRDKWLRDRADRKLGDKVKREVKEAGTLEDLHAALMPVVEIDATPDLVPQGAMVLQPSEERRRSGSHYTPRELTEPIVRTTLEPILARLQGEDGKPPRPERILDLKVCDPAMGSGAFLVEGLPPARRRPRRGQARLGRGAGDPARRGRGNLRPPFDCPALPVRGGPQPDGGRPRQGFAMAGDPGQGPPADLHRPRPAARGLPWSGCRRGRSRHSIGRPRRRSPWASRPWRVREHVEEVARLRELIRGAGEETADWELRDLWNQAQFALRKVRLFGDLATAAFFDGAKPKQREAKRREYGEAIFGGKAEQYLDWLDERRKVEPPLAPFHWEVEFPELFNRENPGVRCNYGEPSLRRSRDCG